MDRPRLTPRARRPRRPGLWDGGFGLLEVRHIQPYEALKAYVCPGCHQQIPAGAGHVVVVPSDAPDLRRHWHRACWTRRESTPAG